MNILLAYGYAQESVATYFDAALRAEHRVVTCGPSTDRPQDIPCDPIEHVQDILARLPEGFEPDLFWWIESHTAFLPRGVETLDCPTVAYETAALWNHFWAARYVRDYDIVAVNRRRPDVYEAAGNQLVFSLPNAAAEWMVGDVFGERTIDVAFLGSINPTLYPDRARLLGRLRHLADRHKLTLKVATGLQPDQLAEVYQSAKIVFNAGTLGEGLNMRVLETMSCGALSFTENGTPPGVSQFFEDRKHLVMFEEDDFEAPLLHYLRHDADRLEIAAAGQAEVLARHRYVDRIRQVLAEVAALGQAPRAKPWRPGAERLLDQAAVQYFRGRNDMARQTLAELSAVAPHHPELPHAVAVVEAAIGEVDAGELFEKALTRTPSPVTAVSYARWLLEQGRLDEAEAIGSGLVSWQRKTDLPWFRTYFPYRWDFMRVEWLNVGLADRRDEARAEFLSTQRLAVLAEVAMKRKDLEPARDRLRALVNARPKHWEAWSNLGSVARDLERVDEAIACFNRSLDLNPYDFVARFTLASMLDQDGASEACIRRVRDLALDNYALARDAIALRVLNEDSIILHVSLNQAGKAHAQLGETQEARACWRRSLADRPEQPDIRALAEGKTVVPARFRVGPEFDTSASTLWLVAARSGWERPLAEFIGSPPPDTALVLHSGAHDAALLQDEVAAWLQARSIDPDEIPDLLLVDDTQATLVAMCRRVTAIVDNGDDTARSVAEALNLPFRRLPGVVP